MIGLCYVCDNAIKEKSIKCVGANDDGAIFQQTCDEGHFSFVDAHGDVLANQGVIDGVS